MSASFTFKPNPNVKRQVHDAAARGLRKAAEDVLDASLAQVPTDPGNELAESGEVSVDDAALRAAVSYGRSGPAKEYAVRQHEQMSLQHDSGRKAKFLEDPLNAAAHTAGETIAAEIRKTTGG